MHDDLARFSISVINIEIQDLSYLATLPLLHKDPFDRLLVSQAATRGFTLLTTDGALDVYRVPILWK